MLDNDRIVGFLFDLDGVLIDSETQYSKIWAQINQEFPTGVENLEIIIKGTTLPKILNDYYPDDDIKLKVSHRLHELESQMKYDYLPGAYDFLNELKHRELPRALVTSSDNKKMEHLWEERPELKGYFDFIITADLIKTSKPSPEGYLLGASKLNIPPGNCVVFEDSLQGVMAGKNAGAFVVGVCGTLPAAKLKPYADILINSFEELDLDNLIQNLINI